MKMIVEKITSKDWWKKIMQVGLVVGGGIVLLGLIISVSHYLVYKEKVIPHVWVGEIEVSNMKEKEVESYLKRLFESKVNEVELVYPDGRREMLTDLGVERDWLWTAKQAMGVGRGGNPLTQINERVISFVEGKEVIIPLKYEVEGLEGVIVDIKEKTEVEVIPAKLVVEEVGEEKIIKIDEGEEGLTLEEGELKKDILEAWRKPGKQVVEIKTKEVGTGIKNERVVIAMKMAEGWLEKEMYLFYKDEGLVLEEEKIMDLIGLGDEAVKLNVFEEIYEELRKILETGAENAVFKFEAGVVIEFKPEVVGVKIKKEELKKKLEEALERGEEKVEIEVEVDEPEIKAGEINDLGIVELVGKGESTFYHSISGRVFNVALAASRINQKLIAPGEIFSFNRTLGEVSTGTGYKTAYVIKDGRTILGDGGGVCQVSTTMFRAALSAGLPIVERRAHSYRVGYYEQDAKAGFDATVYSPSADLKFENNTGKYLLIQTKTDTRNYSLKIDLYGTDDGRIVEISEPRVFGLIPPPEDLYVDDPTLPTGVVKQIDWKSWGATSIFNYVVRRGGETLTEKTFYSVYKPWQAVFLRGTQV